MALTVDAELNKTALAALNGHRGVVAVYDYTNGDVKCLVSSPTYDPKDPPADVNENSAYEGVYLNRFFSGVYPPGSTFKLVTTAAALEKKKDLDSFRFTCTGSTQIGDGVVTCPYAHGQDMDLNRCLACSCNGAYAALALELGANTLEKYAKDAGSWIPIRSAESPLPRGASTRQTPDRSGWAGPGWASTMIW